MTSRDYYNRRVGLDGGPPKLSLAEVATQVSGAYVFVDRHGHLQRSFGYDCVDAGDVPGLDGSDLRDALYLNTGIKVTSPMPEFVCQSDEVALFTVIEFVFDHVAKPAPDAGWHHTFSGCGWHFNCRDDKFDQAAARTEWRVKVNAVLKYYDDGYELSKDGEIVRIAPDGMTVLVQTKLPPKTATTDQAKVANAVRTFHLGRSSREERKQAVRDLVDVLEYHRDHVKKQLSKDEADLFNIANNFALRHHRVGQKDDYDDAWLTWLFYVYLSTVHLVLGRVFGTAATLTNDATSPAQADGPSSDDEIRF